MGLQSISAMQTRRTSYGTFSVIGKGSVFEHINGVPHDPSAALQGVEGVVCKGFLVPATFRQLPRSPFDHATSSGACLCKA